MVDYKEAAGLDPAMQEKFSLARSTVTSLQVALGPLPNDSGDTPIITVTKDGQYYLWNDQLTLDELAQSLTQKKLSMSDFAAVLRGDADAEFGRVHAVIDLLTRLGVHGVKLVTKPTDQVQEHDMDATTNPPLGEALPAPAPPVNWPPAPYRRAQPSDPGYVPR
jgi:biopolymer transport protein ExbD